MSLLAELTFRCPLKCPYCSNPMHLGRYANELGTEDWLRVIREAAELGVIQIHFSGGEPLVRRDLAEMVREARRLELYSDLSTSAVGADEARLTELREAGLDAIQISLLDARADKNDWLGGTKSYEKKVRAVETAKALGFPVTLNVVLHRHNLDFLEQAVALAQKWEVERLELAHVQYTGWAFRNRLALLPSAEQLEHAREVVAQAKEDTAGRMEILHVVPDYYQDLPKPCLRGWGQVFLSVAPDGAVMPCQTAREIPGLEFPTVHDASLEEIWFRSPIFNKFRGTDWMPEPCQSCDRKEIDFGGCRCQAYLITGDAAATDPVCHLSPHHHLVTETVAQSQQGDPELVYRVIRD